MKTTELELPTNKKFGYFFTAVFLVATTYFYINNASSSVVITIGVIGLGRIGKRVLNLLRSFGTPKLLLNDISPNLEVDREFKVEWVTKEEIYKQADVITLHLPLTKLTKNMVRKEHLKMMKPDAILINTARGGIINEDDLYEFANQNVLLSEIEQHFGFTPKLRYISIGKKGILILCDTNGYHRGLTPITGYRAMLTINYFSNNPKNGFLKNIID